MKMQDWKVLLLVSDYNRIVQNMNFWISRMQDTLSALVKQKIFFFKSNATTCPLWTSWSPLPVVAEV
jgi:hypothetical protein